MMIAFYCLICFACFISIVSFVLNLFFLTLFVRLYEKIMTESNNNAQLPLSTSKELPAWEIGYIEEQKRLRKLLEESQKNTNII